MDAGPGDDQSHPGRDKDDLNAMDFTTLENVKLYSDMQGAKDDALVKQLITGYSAHIENECNQTLGQTTFTNQIVDAFVDPDGLLVCYLHVPVIQSFTGAGWRRSTASPQGGYLPLDPTNVDIDARPHGTSVRFFPALGSLKGHRIKLQLSYTGGYSGLNTGAYPIPADLELAARRLTWWGYKKKDAALDRTAIS